MQAWLTLKTVKAASFRNLDFSREPGSKVLQNNPIACSKKSQNVFDKVLFIRGQLFPMGQIL
jgi:hypothetical protein